MFHSALAIQYSSIILLLFLSAYIAARWKTRMQGLLLLNCIVTLVNNAGYLAVMLAKDSNSSLLGIQLSYLGRVWIPYTLLWFSLELCRIEVKKSIMLLLAFFHGTVYFLVLFAKEIPIYYSSITFIEEGLFPHNVYGYGFVHTLYTSFLICYIVIGLTVLIRNTVNEKDRNNRKRLLLVTSAIAVECVFYILEICGGGKEFDTTVMGYAIASMMMAIAIFRYDLMNTLELAKDYVADELSEGIIAVGKRETIEYCNKPALRIFPELKDNGEEILSLVSEKIRNNETIERNDRIYTPSYRELWQNGSREGYVLVLKDDTEYYFYTKRLQEEKDKAEKANASKSRFVSVVSHELRTPMNAVVGMTEILLRDQEALSEKQTKYLRNIASSGKALVEIVNDILDQSKLEAGKMEVIPAPYALRPLVDEIMMIMENRKGDKDIKLEKDISASVPDSLSGDSLRIRQIIINLMNNAVKFTEDGFIRLSVSVEKEEEDTLYIHFSVKDSGQGIREEDLRKLGEAFSQVDQEKNHQKEGTGLGISISKDFISLMGGKLEVRSKYGEGTEFFFTIPQKWTEEEREDHQDDSTTFSGKKVLIVDDTELNLLVATELLFPTGADIRTVSSGKDALETLREEEYDIVFMDYIMPEMDGAETTREIRNTTSRTLPIVALTGDTSVETVNLLRDAGISDILSKPVEYEDMTEMMRKYLH